MMWIRIVILIYLSMLGFWDYRERKVPLWLLTIGGVAACSAGIYRCAQGELRWSELLLGMIPGVFLLLTARFSEKAGYADGLVLTELGVCLGYREVMLLFGFSLLLLSVCSIVLLLLRKVHRNTKMPYLSFLAVIFLVRQFGGG